MANVIKLRKGLDINLKGKAAEEIAAVTVSYTHLTLPTICSV